MGNNWKEKVAELIVTSKHNTDTTLTKEIVLSKKDFDLAYSVFEEFGDLVVEATKKECLSELDNLSQVDKENILSINKPNL